MRRVTAISVLVLAPGLLLAQVAGSYYPGRHDDWQRKSAAEAGFNASKLDEAIAFIQSKESKKPRDLREAHYLSFNREPHGEPIGPYKDRGDMTGVILRGG